MSGRRAARVKRQRAAREARQQASAPEPGSTIKRRTLRIVVVVVAILGYAAIMWYLVFPWVDRTFVNRPSL